MANTGRREKVDRWRGRKVSLEVSVKASRWRIEGRRGGLGERAVCEIGTWSWRVRS